MLRLAAFALLIPATALAQAPNVRPGLWEITTSTEMAGMPTGQKPFVMKRCVKPEEARDPKQVVPQQSQGKCEMTDYKASGNGATWKVACKGEGAMNGTGTITWQGEAYSGANVFEMNQGGQAMTMTQKYTGRRLGDCS